MKVEIVLGDEFKRQFKRLANYLTPHIPSLSPSPARGMFRFGNMVSDVSFEIIK